MSETILSTEEAKGIEECLIILKSVPWAQKLVSKVTEKGINAASMDFLFEARFAAGLALRKDLSMEYEFETGVGNSSVDIKLRSVDFKITGNQKWLAELMRINKSEAVKGATETQNEFTTTSLINPKYSAFRETENEKKAREKKNKESCEGEMLLVQQKIGEKVFQDGKPIKFPEVRENGPFQAILVDTREYLNGGNEDEYRQIAYGTHRIPEIRAVWEGNLITGVFEKNTIKKQRAAKYIQERIHLIGFVAENKQCDKDENLDNDGNPEGARFPSQQNRYLPGKILKCIKFVFNPLLFDTPEKINDLENKLKADFGDITLLMP